MNIGSILAKVGTAVIKDVVPMGGLVVDAINALLPDDKKLPEAVTGAEAKKAIEATLPADQQLQLLMKEVDVEIAEINAWPKIQASLMEADKVGASTRPQIAKMMAWVVVYAVVIFISMWGLTLWKGTEENLKALSDAWPLMLTVLATPTALLRSYFGMRSQDKRERYRVAIGKPKTNVLVDILNTIKGGK